MPKFIVEVESSRDPDEYVAWLNDREPGSARLVIADGVRPVERRSVEELVAGLLQYQRRWIEDRSEFRVWDADRRLGCSWAVLVEALAVASDDGPGGGGVIIVVGSLADAECYRDELRTLGHQVEGLGSSSCFVCTSTPYPIVVSLAVTGIAADCDGVTLGPDGRAALLSIDNSRETGMLAYHPSSWLGVLAKIARRVSVVGTGLRAMPKYRWSEVVARVSVEPGVSLHVTTIKDALADGLGRRLCEVRGLEYSPAWESGWVEELREFDPDGKEFRL